jgi:hypothetical protein
MLIGNERFKLELIFKNKVLDTLLLPVCRRIIHHS